MMKKIKIIFLSLSFVFFLVLTIDNVKADDNLEKQIQTGWQEIAGSKYYFDETGTMAKGVYEIAGEKYLFGVNTGKLYTSGSLLKDGDEFGFVILSSDQLKKRLQIKK